jgi:hypothetical protein
MVLIMMKNNKKRAGITVTILTGVLCVSVLTTVAASSVLGKSFSGQVKLQLETGEVVEPKVEYQIHEDENATQMTITELGDSKPLVETEIPTVQVYLPEGDTPNVEMDFEITDANIDPPMTITEMTITEIK